ncbi:MAG: hypothetical protein J0M08_05075 [Bacteroidetes bacterium]|nr:hypothetical protein [Bacteroidota bacterium]
MIKRILKITFLVILIVGFFVSLGFVDKEQNKLKCKDIIVNIDNEDLFFVESPDIKAYFKDKGDSIVNQLIKTVDIAKLEHVLQVHPAIDEAQVYIDGRNILQVHIKQRKPVVRIYNANGENYYLDNKGRLMPISEKYAARVLIANGSIYEPYNKRYLYSVEDILKNDFAKYYSKLDDIYAIAEYLSKNSFWNSQIQQLFVNEENEIELIPIVGNHIIVFGDGSDVEEKFTKLKLFYLEGLNKTGWWNNYAVINVKYKGQLVCTKRY